MDKYPKYRVQQISQFCTWVIEIRRRDTDDVPQCRFPPPLHSDKKLTDGSAISIATGCAWPFRYNAVSSGKYVLYNIQYDTDNGRSIIFLI